MNRNVKTNTIATKSFMEQYMEMANSFFHTEANPKMTEMILSNIKKTSSENGVDIYFVPQFPISLIRFPKCQHPRVNTVKLADVADTYKNFSMRKVGAITIVSYNGYNDCADGHGRVTVASLRGIEYIPAFVHVPTGTIDIEDYIREMFKSQYVGCRPMKRVHQHEARVEGGDGRYAALDRACKAKGVLVYANPKDDITPVLKDYMGAAQCTARFGDEGLEWIFDMIHEANWDADDSKKHAYSRYVIRPLTRLYKFFSKEENKKLETLMKVYLKSTTPKRILAKAIEKYANRTEAVACAMVIADEVIQMEVRNHEGMSGKAEYDGVDSVYANFSTYEAI